MSRKTQTIGKNLEEEKLKQLPLKEAVFVSPDTGLFVVFERMRASKSGCALIRKGDEILGIFTERDVLTRVIEAKTPLTTPVEKVMTRNPSTLPIDSTISKAIRIMHDGGRSLLGLCPTHLQALSQDRVR